MIHSLWKLKSYCLKKCYGLVFEGLIFAEQNRELCEVKKSISQLKGRINYTPVLLQLMSFISSIPRFCSYSTIELEIINLTVVSKS